MVYVAITKKENRQVRERNEGVINVLRYNGREDRRYSKILPSIRLGGEQYLNGGDTENEVRGLLGDTVDSRLRVSADLDGKNRQIDDTNVRGTVDNKLWRHDTTESLRQHGTRADSVVLGPSEPPDVVFDLSIGLHSCSGISFSTENLSKAASSSKFTSKLDGLPESGNIERITEVVGVDGRLDGVVGGRDVDVTAREGELEVDGEGNVLLTGGRSGLCSEESREPYDLDQTKALGLEQLGNLDALKCLGADSLVALKDAESGFADQLVCIRSIGDLLKRQKGECGDTESQNASLGSLVLSESLSSKSSVTKVIKGNDGGVLELITETSEHLVNHALTNGREVDFDGDTERGEDVRVADTRELEDLGAVDGTR